MKRFYALIFILLMVLLLTGCDRGGNKTPDDTSVQTVDVGDSRFLLMELEGTGATEAQVTVWRTEKKKDTCETTEEFAVTHDGGFRYYALLPSGGTYLVSITCPNGLHLTRMIVFDESQVCSIHMSLDLKDSENTRHLWTESPYNNRH